MPTVYVIKMIQRGTDEPDYQIEKQFTGKSIAEQLSLAIDHAEWLNERNEASWRHYFASQYPPDEIIWNG
ncbi:hypothetical protein [Vibrio phage VpV262]|uniref:Uncharacterized protein n=1 Tax=Vibrio phage VpV262 TaxID=2907796 RepID=Q8LT90_9CAUD|nr:hypothetical protein VpV262p09 [Vibrio phage VpV262]AAM28357.1 hypothetical protein [Vibrio phage VpV262]